MEDSEQTFIGKWRAATISDLSLCERDQMSVRKMLIQTKTCKE